jgi:predicted AAA+ superfamily ATPase
MNATKAAAKLAWKPWHRVVHLRDDLRSGELSLAIFAADLYDVVMGKAKPVYQKPEEFFALTYPTFNLRELVKDILLRLAAKNEKAVRQLELTYGGGKTHTLITLFHLVFDPRKLPDLPAVKEFIEHAGTTPPQSRIAVLAFDKFDVEKGMEIRDPSGRERWLRQPWSALAWQIAGSEGLKLFHADGRDEERETPPAENLLVELLSVPGKQGLATLLLVDEVLMFARGKIGLDPSWRGKLQNFFQYLTQAVTKVDRCAMVASLLATDPRKSDKLGKEITQELYAIFRREREEGVQPVVKEDVAEVLRRRFFKPESIKDRELFRSHVVAALKGIGDLDEQTRKDGKAAEDRFLDSYPFHPDLTEVFYSKWTQLEGFQRTRGVLRTFALALREAEKWDNAPLVATNVFLTAPGKEDISEGLRELTTIAAAEEYEGKRQEWSGILQGELAKARAIQAESPGLRFREIEQAVGATFFHSQPIGQKASVAELLKLLGHTRPDKIELEKGLRRWAEVSWFLDEAAISEAETGPKGEKQLPKTWRLGSRPNLKQMHNDAQTHVSPELVEAKLIDAIASQKSLTTGASAAGARVHTLPTKPSDVDDDGEFHYAVLGPRGASMPGAPSGEARRFIEETTSPDRPRVYRNAVVLAVLSRDGLDAARKSIRDYLAWEEVRNTLKDQEIDPLRLELLTAYVGGAKGKIPESIQQAYSIVVTVSDKNEIQAFKITVTGEPLFNLIKGDSRSRIQDSPISADALLPGGPYDLWREGETSRRVKDLVGAFAQFVHLPKMLRRREILETLVLGAKEGFFVLRATRPDRSVRTIWRQEPEEADLKDPSLEVVLAQEAELTAISPLLLAPGGLPQLWTGSELRVGEIYSYFAGGNVVKVKKNGYEEPVVIPKAARAVIDSAVSRGAREGLLWLTSGPATLLGEEIPTGLLNENAVLQAPPLPLAATDIAPSNLPEAWDGDVTTGIAVSAALSKRLGKNLPWATVRNAIDAALKARMVELAGDSGLWPCDYPGAASLKLRVPTKFAPPPPPPPPTVAPGVRVAEADFASGEIQDLADNVSDLMKASIGCELKFKLRIEIGGDPPPSEETVAKVNAVLQRIREDIRLR